jgi:hypothetical protein
VLQRLPLSEESLFFILDIAAELVEKKWSVEIL